MAIFTVTSNLDESSEDGVTTLREAVAMANASAGDDIVVFDQTVFARDATIRLTQGEIVISEAVQIDGASADGAITITGDRNGDDQLVAGSDITDIRQTEAARLADNSRVFLIEDRSYAGAASTSTETILTALTITGGYAGDGDGGGVRSDSRSYLGGVIIEDSIIAGNGATGAGGGVGGGLITIDNSIIRGNVADGSGGGVSGFDVIVTGSEVSGNATRGEFGFGGGVGGYFIEISDSTIADNVVYGDLGRGGGAAGATITVRGSTITGNSTRGVDGFGGGMSGGNVFVDRSIIVGNYSAQSTFEDAFLSYSDYVSFTLVGEGDTRGGENGITVVAPEDVFAETRENGPVRAGVLSDESGFSLTVALLRDEDNPAIDAAPPAVGGFDDQTGDLRFVDLLGVDNGGIQDLGARELQEFDGGVVILADGLTGSRGRDVIAGRNAADVIAGFGGNDFLAGRDGDDTLFGNAGRDNLFGNDGADLLRGGKGSDVLDGGTGDDALFGGGLRDALFGDRGDDRLFGQSGADNLNGGRGDDLLRGGKGGDQLLGSNGEDTLFGGGGRDDVFGGVGDDLVSGGRGRDRVGGDIGDDTLDGGAGRDIFVFLDHLQSDLIVDFVKGVDRIEFQIDGSEFSDLDFAQDGADALISIGSTEIRVGGFEADDFDQGDFIF